VATICIAEKNRLTVRGVQNGKRYLVKKERDGWWIESAPQTVRRSRQLSRAGQDLSDHLDALAAEGFSFEPAQKENVPPCRF
jgi:hypothetical protein